MKRTTARLLRLFITGALAVLPLAATVAVFWWLGSLFLRHLGPESPLGSVVVRIGLGITGSEVVAYLLVMGAVAVLLLLLGAVVETGIQAGAARLLQAVLRRIPLVRTVYDLLQRLVGLLAQRDEGGARSMSAVWCHFGGIGGAAVLALLSTPEPVPIGERRYVGVLVPTAPVPVGGGLIFVPEDWVRPAHVGVEALTSIYVSMGVTSAQHLVAPAAAAPGPAQPPGPPAAGA